MTKQGMFRRMPGGVVVAAVVAAAVALVSGCSTAPNNSASLAPPKNYRQQVAAKIRQMEDNPSVIQYVGVTRPKQMWTGIQNGGTRPAVCAQVVRPNIFGLKAAWYYLFYFENGQVHGYRMQTPSMITCQPPLTTITGLVRSGK
jgi:hypothetical protein